MQKPAFLPLLRDLARCYQTFEWYSSQHIRSLDLTACQFDIIVTLGNTAGMSFRELGNRTLITKGTLTGVINRLEDKNIVQHTTDVNDGRSQIVCLTESGVELFQQVFPAHLAHMEKAFRGIDETEIYEMRKMLTRLGEAFQSPKESI